MAGSNRLSFLRLVFIFVWEDCFCVDQEVCFIRSQRIILGQPIGWQDDQPFHLLQDLLSQCYVFCTSGYLRMASYIDPEKHKLSTWSTLQCRICWLSSFGCITLTIGCWYMPLKFACQLAPGFPMTFAEIFWRPVMNHGKPNAVNLQVRIDYSVVKVYKKLWTITILYGKNHYKSPFSMAMFVYQTVIPLISVHGRWSMVLCLL